MLFRLVRPLKRSDSSIPQFVQRIPADVRQRAIGQTIVVPLGDGHVAVTIGPAARSVRFSLRSGDPSEAKRRQGIVAAHLEGVWRSLRETKPVSLTNRQATALAGELYAAWVDGEGRERTTAVGLTRFGGHRGP